jgi:hypothetical protein
LQFYDTSWTPYLFLIDGEFFPHSPGAASDSFEILRRLRAVQAEKHLGYVPRNKMKREID